MIRRFLPLAALVATLSGQASALKDPQWADWLDKGRTEQLESAAQARLAARPDEAQAQVALALAQADRIDGARLDAAHRSAEDCISAHRDEAACYYALGAVQGVQALAGGAMKAISLAGKVRDNLGRALELDPGLLEARVLLAQFYLRVPGIAGGSMSKARELAAGAPTPGQAALVRALVAAQAKDWAAEERELRGIKAGGDAALKSAVREAWGQLGTDLMWAKQPDKAQEVFRALQRDWPQHALGWYAMGRLEASQGRNEEAVRLFEKAASMDGADKLPIDHRLGQALADKGDKAEARRALERFVANKRSNPANVKDARKLLGELGQG
ncbi:lipopolysaccharide assembly protein LapB [Pelomonas sp. KK5]|uniref:tetratricopeptide repeat protein n=1 Tax=Pelomonas sp. KK5 TaxID=1855730 RepID=UPI00117E40BC|nr:tetratricopeptide repeat protein [Pelomonas sp. KK5]